VADIVRRVTQRLWLLRHGEAVPHDAAPDAQRALTPRGEEQSRLAGRALARLGTRVDVCYASPKVRAWDTARLALEALDIEPLEERALAGDFDGDDARELLLGHDADARVLIVGHEPDFSQVVYDLTGARVEFKKGGLACVRMGPPPELTSLLRPHQLEVLGGGAPREPRGA
jgi:phosphohistidine phosphatase